MVSSCREQPCRWRKGSHYSLELCGDGGGGGGLRLSSQEEKVANVDDYLSRFISPLPLPPPCRDSICVVNILKGSPLLFLLLPFIYLFLRLFSLLLFISPPSPHQPPLFPSSPPSARYSPSYFSFFSLNCLTPKIQISQLGDPVSFLKNEHITSYISLPPSPLSHPTQPRLTPHIAPSSLLFFLSPLPSSSLFVTINISIYMQIIIY